MAGDAASRCSPEEIAFASGARRCHIELGYRISRFTMIKAHDGSASKQKEGQKPFLEGVWILLLGRIGSRNQPKLDQAGTYIVARNLWLHQ